MNFKIGDKVKVSIKNDNENYNDFSSHNIRKTHGNWLKVLKVDGLEIASRLGHDPATMLKHYVSPNLFNEQDKELIKEILGDLDL